MMRKNRDEILKPGTVFEKYTVEKLLGHGGMGAVYLVRHNVLDTFFALKVLFPDVASKNRQFVDRFIREAKLACKIRHPNLITVHDAGQNPDNRMYYIIMDYVEGCTLKQTLLRDGPMDWNRAESLFLPVVNAMSQVHRAGLVHRDISPDNLMILPDGTVTILDLGAAKDISGGASVP